MARTRRLPEIRSKQNFLPRPYDQVRHVPELIVQWGDDGQRYISGGPTHRWRDAVRNGIIVDAPEGIVERMEEQVARAGACKLSARPGPVKVRLSRYALVIWCFRDDGREVLLSRVSEYADAPRDQATCV